MSFSGQFFHLATSFHIAVDGVVVCAKIGTPLEAFTLNISYPASVGASMEYVPR
jgi:hypothetical protein